MNDRKERTVKAIISIALFIIACYLTYRWFGLKVLILTWLWSGVISSHTEMVILKEKKHLRELAIMILEKLRSGH